MRETGCRADIEWINGGTENSWRPACDYGWRGDDNRADATWAKRAADAHANTN